MSDIGLSIPVTADTRPAQAKLEGLIQRANSRKLSVKVDTSNASKKITQLDKQIDKTAKDTKIDIKADGRHASNWLKGFKRSLAKPVSFRVGTGGSTTEVKKLNTELKKTKLNTQNLNNSDFRNMNANIKRIALNTKTMNAAVSQAAKAIHRFILSASLLYGVSSAVRSLVGSWDSVTNSVNRVNLVLQQIDFSDEITRQVNESNSALQRLGLVKNVNDMSERITPVEALKDLYDISRKTKVSIDSTMETFFRFGQALGDRTNMSELKQVAETVNKALVIGGSANASGAAAIFQLGQGLAADALRGQELNSVLEQAPRLAKVIADALEVPVGSLRALAEEGKLTTQVVMDAFKSQREVVDSEYKTINHTVGANWKVLMDTITRYHHGVLNKLGAPAVLKNLISSVDNFLMKAVDSNAYVIEGIIRSIHKVIIVLGILKTVIFETFGDVIDRSIIKAFVPITLLEKAFIGLSGIVYSNFLQMTEVIGRPFRILLLGRKALLEVRVQTLFAAKSMTEFKEAAVKITEVFTGMNTGLRYLPTQFRTFTASIQGARREFWQQFQPSMFKRVIGGFFLISTSFGELVDPIVIAFTRIRSALHVQFAFVIRVVIGAIKTLGFHIKTAFWSVFNIGEYDFDFGNMFSIVKNMKRLVRDWSEIGFVAGAFNPKDLFDWQFLKFDSHNFSKFGKLYKNRMRETGRTLRKVFGAEFSFINLVRRGNFDIREPTKFITDYFSEIIDSASSYLKNTNIPFPKGLFDGYKKFFKSDVFKEGSEHFTKNFKGFKRGLKESWRESEQVFNQWTKGLRKYERGFTSIFKEKLLSSYLESSTEVEKKHLNKVLFGIVNIWKQSIKAIRLVIDTGVDLFSHFMRLFSPANFDGILGTLRNFGDIFYDIFRTLFNSVVSLGFIFVDILKTIVRIVVNTFLAIGHIGPVKKVIDYLSSAFSVILQPIVFVFDTIYRVIKGTFIGLGIALQGILSGLYTVVELSFKGILHLFTKLGTFIENVFNIDMSGVKTQLKKIPEFFVSIFNKISSISISSVGMKQVFIDIWEFVKRIFSQLSDFVQNSSKNMYGTVSNLFGKIIEVLKSVYESFKSVGSRLFDFLDPQKAKSAIQSVINTFSGLSLPTREKIFGFLTSESDVQTGWESLNGFFNSILNMFKQFGIGLTAAISSIKVLFSNLGVIFKKETWGEGIVQGFKNTFNSLVDAVIGYSETWRVVATSLLNMIREFVNGVVFLGKMLGDVFKKMFTGIGNVKLSSISSPDDDVKNISKFSAIYTKIKNVIVSALKKVGQAIKTSYTYIYKFVSKIWKKISDSTFDIIDSMTSNILKRKKKHQDDVLRSYKGAHKDVLKEHLKSRDDIVDTYESYQENVTKEVGKVSESIKNSFDNAKDTIDDFNKGMRDQSDGIEVFGRRVGQGLGQFSRDLSDVQDAAKEAFEGISDSAEEESKHTSDIFEGLERTIGKTFESIKNFFNRLGNSFTGEKPEEQYTSWFNNLHEASENADEIARNVENLSSAFTKIKSSYGLGIFILSEEEEKAIIESYKGVTTKIRSLFSGLFADIEHTYFSAWQKLGLAFLTYIPSWLDLDEGLMKQYTTSFRVDLVVTSVLLHYKDNQAFRDIIVFLSSQVGKLISQTLQQMPRLTGGAFEFIKDAVQGLTKHFGILGEVIQRVVNWFPLLGLPVLLFGLNLLTLRLQAIGTVWKNMGKAGQFALGILASRFAPIYAGVVGAIGIFQLLQSEHMSLSTVTTYAAVAIGLFFGSYITNLIKLGITSKSVIKPLIELYKDLMKWTIINKTVTGGLAVANRLATVTFGDLYLRLKAYIVGLKQTSAAQAQTSKTATFLASRWGKVAIGAGAVTALMFATSTAFADTGVELGEVESRWKSLGNEIVNFLLIGSLVVTGVGGIVGVLGVGSRLEKGLTGIGSVLTRVGKVMKATVVGIVSGALTISGALLTMSRSVITNMASLSSNIITKLTPIAAGISSFILSPIGLIVTTLAIAIGGITALIINHKRFMKGAFDDIYTNGTYYADQMSAIVKDLKSAFSDTNISLIGPSLGNIKSQDGGTIDLSELSKKLEDMNLSGMSQSHVDLLKQQSIKISQLMSSNVHTLQSEGKLTRFQIFRTTKAIKDLEKSSKKAEGVDTGVVALQLALTAIKELDRQGVSARGLFERYGASVGRNGVVSSSEPGFFGLTSPSPFDSMNEVYEGLDSNFGDRRVNIENEILGGDPDILNRLTAELRRGPLAHDPFVKGLMSTMESVAGAMESTSNRLLNEGIPNLQLAKDISSLSRITSTMRDYDFESTPEGLIEALGNVPQSEFGNIIQQYSDLSGKGIAEAIAGAQDDPGTATQQFFDLDRDSITGSVIRSLIGISPDKLKETLDTLIQDDLTRPDIDVERLKSTIDQLGTGELFGQTEDGGAINWVKNFFAGAGVTRPQEDLQADLDYLAGVILSIDPNSELERLGKLQNKMIDIMNRIRDINKSGYDGFETLLKGQFDPENFRHLIPSDKESFIGVADSLRKQGEELVAQINADLGTDEYKFEVGEDGLLDLGEDNAAYAVANDVQKLKFQVLNQAAKDLNDGQFKFSNTIDKLNSTLSTAGIDITLKGINEGESSYLFEMLKNRYVEIQTQLLGELDPESRAKLQQELEDIKWKISKVDTSRVNRIVNAAKLLGINVQVNPVWNDTALAHIEAALNNIKTKDLVVGTKAWYKALLDVETTSSTIDSVFSNLVKNNDKVTFKNLLNAEVPLFKIKEAYDEMEAARRAFAEAPATTDLDQLRELNAELERTKERYDELLNVEAYRKLRTDVQLLNDITSEYGINMDEVFIYGSKEVVEEFRVWEQKTYDLQRALQAAADSNNWEEYQDLLRQLKDIEKQGERLARQRPFWHAWLDEMKPAFGDAFHDIITGAKSFSDGLKDLFDDIARHIIKRFSQDVGDALYDATLGRLTGSGGRGGGGGVGEALWEGGKWVAENVFGIKIGRSQGGPVYGPGGPTDDKIPAMLSNGEFVINAKATKKHRPLLEQINAYKDGGIVGSVNTPTTTDVVTPGTSLTGDTFSLMIETITKSLRPETGLYEAFMESMKTSGEIEKENAAGLVEEISYQTVRIQRAFTELGESIGESVTNLGTSLEGSFTRAIDTNIQAANDNANSIISEIRDISNNISREISSYTSSNDLTDGGYEDLSLDEETPVNQEIVDSILEQIKPSLLIPNLFGGANTGNIDNEVADGIIEAIRPSLFGFNFGDGSTGTINAEVADGIIEAIRPSLFGFNFGDGSTGTINEEVAEGILEVIKPSLVGISLPGTGVGSDSTGTEGSTTQDVLNNIPEDTTTRVSSLVGSSWDWIRGFNTGGIIYGPGGVTGDKIPAMLSSGEFVVNAKAARAHRPLLERINSYKEGGSVGDINTRGTTTTDYSVTGDTFSLMIETLSKSLRPEVGLYDTFIKSMDTNEQLNRENINTLVEEIGYMTNSIQLSITNLGEDLKEEISNLGTSIQESFARSIEDSNDANRENTRELISELGKLTDNLIEEIRDVVDAIDNLNDNLGSGLGQIFSAISEGISTVDKPLDDLSGTDTPDTTTPNEGTDTTNTQQTPDTSSTTSGGGGYGSDDQYNRGGSPVISDAPTSRNIIINNLQAESEAPVVTTPVIEMHNLEDATVKSLSVLSNIEKLMPDTSRLERIQSENVVMVGNQMEELEKLVNQDERKDRIFNDLYGFINSNEEVQKSIYDAVVKSGKSTGDAEKASRAFTDNPDALTKFGQNMQQSYIYKGMVKAFDGIKDDLYGRNIGIDIEDAIGHVTSGRVDIGDLISAPKSDEDKTEANPWSIVDILEMAQIRKERSDLDKSIDIQSEFSPQLFSHMPEVSGFAGKLAFTKTGGIDPNQLYGSQAPGDLNKFSSHIDSMITRMEGVGGSFANIPTESVIDFPSIPDPTPAVDIEPRHVREAISAMGEDIRPRTVEEATTVPSTPTLSWPDTPITSDEVSDVLANVLGEDTHTRSVVDTPVVSPFPDTELQAKLSMDILESDISDFSRVMFEPLEEPSIWDKFIKVGKKAWSSIVPEAGASEAPFDIGELYPTGIDRQYWKNPFEEERGVISRRFGSIDDTSGAQVRRDARTGGYGRWQGSDLPITSDEISDGITNVLGEDKYKPPITPAPYVGKECYTSSSLY